MSSFSGQCPGLASLRGATRLPRSLTVRAPAAYRFLPALDKAFQLLEY